jgi:glucan 1,3-beta-glucosidase
MILVVCALGSVWHWWSRSRPVILVDALSERLQCVSYTPFRKSGESPLDLTQFVSADQIDADLKLLAQRFDCVRIYSVSQGMQEVPRLAPKYGLKVMLGIWIGRYANENERELSRGISLARQYPEAISAIIVGNEVLLRSEQPPAALRAFIERVKTAVPGIPVTYADVWEFWLQYRELASAVDFVTIHILPYWEDRPIPIQHAAGHVSHIYQTVAKELPGKEILIGETGWPSYGRQRHGAKPSLVNQARFIREFTVRAELEKVRYNLIEAYDQPWKRLLEGAVGGYWGLYDTQDRPKFPFRGPVAESPSGGLAVIAVISAFFAVFMQRWQNLNRWEIFLLLAVAIGAGSASLGVWLDLSAANRNPTEWIVTGTYGLLAILATFVLGAPLAAWCATGKPPPGIAPVSRLVLWARRNDQSFDSQARTLGALRIAFLFGAAFMCLVLFFDPRYRDFPLALYAVPTVGYSLLSWIDTSSQADLEEILLAGLIAVLTVLIALSEHLVTPREGNWTWAEAVNGHALAWCGLCLLLAGSVLVPVLAELRTRQRQCA